MGNRKIVCGVTASAHSQKAALEAARLAREEKAELVYVYAVDTAFLEKGSTGSLTQDVVAKSLETLGKHILDHASRLAAAQGVSPKSVLRRGRVLEVLKQVLAEEGADLLVIGHEKRTVFERYLFRGVEDHAGELKAQTGTDVKIVS